MKKSNYSDLDKCHHICYVINVIISMLSIFVDLYLLRNDD